MSADQTAMLISDLHPADNPAVEQAAALLMDAFPQWVATAAAARNEVHVVLQPDHLCLAARSGKTVLGWIGAIPQYSHAWELHPLVVRQDAAGAGWDEPSLPRWRIASAREAR